MGVVLEGLLKTALPALTTAIGGPSMMALQVGAAGYQYATAEQAKKAKRTDHNSSLAFENRERQRLVGEETSALRGQAARNNAAGNVKEGVYSVALENFVAGKKQEIQSQTNVAWQKGGISKNPKTDWLKTLGMAAVFAGGVFLGKKYDIGETLTPKKTSYDI